MRLLARGIDWVSTTTRLRHRRLRHEEPRSSGEGSLRVLAHHERRARSQNHVARAGLTCQQIGAHDTGHLGGPVTVVEQEEDLPAPLRLDAVGQVLANGLGLLGVAAPERM